MAEPDPRFLAGETATLTVASEMAFVVAVGWDGACDMQANISKPEMAKHLRHIANELAPDDRIAILEGALTELFGFVTSELDQHPGPWASYLVDPAHAAVADDLERRRSGEADRG